MCPPAHILFFFQKCGKFFSINKTYFIFSSYGKFHTFFSLILSLYNINVCLLAPKIRIEHYTESELC